MFCMMTPLVRKSVPAFLSSVSRLSTLALRSKMGITWLELPDTFLALPDVLNAGLGALAKLDLLGEVEGLLSGVGASVSV